MSKKNAYYFYTRLEITHAYFLGQNLNLLPKITFVYMLHPDLSSGSARLMPVLGHEGYFVLIPKNKFLTKERIEKINNIFLSFIFKNIL